MSAILEMGPPMPEVNHGVIIEVSTHYQVQLWMAKIMIEKGLWVA